MNKKNFDKVIMTFTEIYEKELTLKALEIYFRAFEKIPDDKVEILIEECLKKCKYFPKPADVFECLAEYEPDDYDDDDYLRYPVSYTHLTLPTKRIV